jgi:hypothetical protein
MLIQLVARKRFYIEEGGDNGGFDFFVKLEGQLGAEDGKCLQKKMPPLTFLKRVCCQIVVFLR